jgi:acetolactate synthase I/II/III large subunit
MNGAESLVRTLLGCGIDTCFANPGTSEMHFVAALDRVPGIRCVLALQENSVTGMADGYYRILRKPAATLLHCGPGLTNGMANLHNARRAESGIVNIVGDHARYHQPFDSPLTADVPALSQTFSAFVSTPRSTEMLGQAAAQAAAAARQHPGQIATLILPADISWSEGGSPASELTVSAPPAIDPHSIEAARRMLTSGRRTLLLVGNSVATMEGLELAYAIAARTQAHVMGSSLVAACPRGKGVPRLPKVPYPVDVAIEALAPYDNVVLINCPEPVGFFGYPGKPSQLCRPDAQLHTLSRRDQDGIDALRMLAEALGADRNPHAPEPSAYDLPGLPEGEPTPEKLDAVLAALLPENAIVVDEALTFSNGFTATAALAPMHDHLIITGGAIGGGIPVATGAAIASGGSRRVVNLQADGSAAYTLQALWTQAREKLPCTTILLNNKRYNILIGEYRNVGAVPGPTAMSMLDLGDPDIRWAELARSLGVAGTRVTTMGECARALKASFAEDGPHLIELVI